MRGQALSHLIRENSSHKMSEELWDSLAKSTLTSKFRQVVAHLKKKKNRPLPLTELDQFFKKGFSDSTICSFNFIMGQQQLPVRLFTVETGLRSEFPWQSRHVRLFVIPLELLSEIKQTPH